MVAANSTIIIFKLYYLYYMHILFCIWQRTHYAWISTETFRCTKTCVDNTLLVSVQLWPNLGNQNFQHKIRMAEIWKPFTNWIKQKKIQVETKTRFENKFTAWSKTNYAHSFNQIWEIHVRNNPFGKQRKWKHKEHTP